MPYLGTGDLEVESWIGCAIPPKGSDVTGLFGSRMN
jgi:hypothetical protein